MKELRNKLFGDKRFYLMVLGIAVPIMVQNGITNFVNLLDNIMVGQVGTEQMSGVSIVNQLMFVFNLCIFGAVSGAGIFTAQYFGKGDTEGVRATCRFKFIAVVVLTVLASALFVVYGTNLIQSFLNGNNDGMDAALALNSGYHYLLLMLIGLPPFILEQVYSSTLRECGKTMLPMKAGMVAVLVNLVFNYLLIYGKVGFPQMGVAGAAIATDLSRYVQAAIVIIATHRDKEQNPFVVGLYRTMKIPVTLVKQIIIKGTPLLLNETVWAAGMAMLTQCYSTRGLAVVAGLNVSNTISNLFMVVFIALGDSIAIIIGQLLGAGKMKEARETDTRMITFSVLCCTGVSILMLFVAPAFPKLYQITEESRILARNFIIISAIFMPQGAFLHAAYFTIRSGGKTFITFLFDSVYIWVASVSVAFILSRFTGMSVLWIYICVQFTDTVKCVIGYILVKKGIWLNNIVSET